MPFRLSKTYKNLHNFSYSSCVLLIPHLALLECITLVLLICNISFNIIIMWFPPYLLLFLWFHVFCSALLGLAVLRLMCRIYCWHYQNSKRFLHTFLIIKPTRYTNFSNLFWNETLHVSDSSLSIISSPLYTQQWYTS